MVAAVAASKLILAGQWMRTNKHLTGQQFASRRTAHSCAAAHAVDNADNDRLVIRRGGYGAAARRTG
jgi:hypothetical protein